MRGRTLQVSQEARALHREALVIDLHVDTLLWARSVLRLDLGRRHRPHPLGNPLGNHVDLPRLREGGVDAVGLGVVIRPWGVRPWSRLCRALRESHHILQRHQEQLTLVTSARELLACKEQGRVAALLGVEGAHGLGDDPRRVVALRSMRVTYLGLVHLLRSPYACPSSRLGADRGLIGAGPELIRICEEEGILVDLAHLGPRGVQEAAACCRRAPIVSHTGVAMAHPTWRNLDLAGCRAVADRGGVIGILFHPPYLTGRWRAGVEAVLDHLVALRQAVGTAALALGSDLDGCILLPREVLDCTAMPLVTEGLLRRGFTHAEVLQVLGLNVLRVLQERDR